MNCLRLSVERSGVSEFIFFNSASEEDGEGDEHSDFVDNMKMITKLPGLSYSIKWG